jgi:hypothetical protein
MPETMAQESCPTVVGAGVWQDPSQQIMGCCYAGSFIDEPNAVDLPRELVWHKIAGVGTDDIRGTHHSRQRMDPRPAAASPFLRAVLVSVDG